MGLALEEPSEDDLFITENGILVAIEPELEPFIADLTLDYINGGIALVGNESDC
ncbi:hypothetical protein [Neobacillus sp. D3-1R]|uniref:hypothetical protein n=1 Tax=Neobacillus sp. D3-1R TaxID=3445778 RepID=UPI003F9F37C5